MKPRFLIPVTREGVHLEVPSETLVIPFPCSTIERSTLEYEVEPTPPKSIHIPEAQRYTIFRYYWKSTKRYPWFSIRAIRLSRIVIGSTCLIQNIGPKPCWFYEGAWHAIYGDSGDSHIYAMCGECHYHYGKDHGVIEHRTPTCPECLEVKWEPFTVQPYKHPRDLLKAENKVKAEQRFRARIPTIFDRILFDDEAEEDDPEIEIFAEEADPYDGLEPEGREAKLQARVERAQRIREAKARLRGR